MPDLQYRQDKIQENRKQTPWRVFVKEICSIRPLTLYKNQNIISRYPISERCGTLSGIDEYNVYAGDFLEFWLDISDEEWFFSAFESLYRTVPAWYVLDYWWNENCAYADMCYRSRNCYLSSIVVNDCEDIYYSYNVKDGSKSIFSSLMVWNGSEYVYMSMWIINAYKGILLEVYHR